MTTPHEAVSAAFDDTWVRSHASEVATAAIEALRKGAVERADRMEGEMEAQGRAIFISDYINAILGPPNEVPE